MSYDNTVREKLFTRLGVYVRWWYKLDDLRKTLETTRAGAASMFGLGGTPPHADSLAYEAYEAMSVEIARQKDELESLRQSVASLASQFFGVNAKALMGAPYSTPEEMIDCLIDQMKNNGDSVQSNPYVVSSVVVDPDNAAYPTTLDFGITASEMVKCDHFALTCIDDSTPGQERWSLDSGRLGQYPGDIITQQPLAWGDAGISGLTIPPAQVHSKSDGSVAVDNVKIAGSSPGTNIAPDGRVYLKFHDKPAALLKDNDDIDQLTTLDLTSAVTVTGDDQDPPEPNCAGTYLHSATIDGTDAFSRTDGQFHLWRHTTDEESGTSAWLIGTELNGASWCFASGTSNIIGSYEAVGENSGRAIISVAPVEKHAVFGAESDIDGKLHLSVFKDGNTVIGGTVAQLSETDLIIDNASAANTHDGALYVKVTKGNGTTTGTSKYTIDLYKTSTRTYKVSTGCVDNLQQNALPSSPIVLTAVNNGQVAGVSGQIRLTAFSNLQNCTDSSLVVRVPRYFVQAYRSAGRLEADMVAQGVSYTPVNASVDLLPNTDSGFQTKGTVSLQYVQDNGGIVASGLFYTVDMYRANPSDATTTDGDIVARAGSTEQLRVGAQYNLPFYEVNGSGLIGASVNLASKAWLQNSHAYAAADIRGAMPDTGFTCSAMVSPQLNGQEIMSILGVDGHREFGLRSDGRITYGWRHQDGTTYDFAQSDALVPANSWHHIAASVQLSANAVRVRFYLDGKPAGDVSKNVTCEIGYHDVDCLFDQTSGDHTFRGRVRAISTYDGVLSDSDIALLAHDLLPNTSRLCCVPCDEGTGDILAVLPSGSATMVGTVWEWNGATAFNDGDVFSALVGYTQGDKFTFNTTVTEGGRFQTFLRNNFGKIFPSAQSSSVSEALSGSQE